MSLFQQLVAAYQGHGWSPTQAVNIASVQIRGEGSSLGSGGADAATGGSNGISQWSASRWNQLLHWTSQNGLDPRSVAGQAGFTTYELTKGAYKNVNTNSISDLVNNYEKPAKQFRTGEIARSQAFAKANYGSAGGGGASPSGSSGGGSGPDNSLGAYGYQPGVGDVPDQATLAQLYPGVAPKDAAQDFAQDNPAATGFDTFSGGMSADPNSGVDLNGNPTSLFGSSGDNSIPDSTQSAPMDPSGSLFGGGGGGGGNGLPGPLGDILNGHDFASVAGMIPGPAGAAISSVAGSLPSMAGIGGGALTAGGTADANSGQGGLGDSATGAPIYITDIAAAGGAKGGAGPEIQSGLTKVADTSAKDIQALDQTNQGIATGAEASGTGWLQYIGNLTYDTLPRLGVMIVGAILIGLAIWLIGKEKTA